MPFLPCKLPCKRVDTPFAAHYRRLRRRELLAALVASEYVSVRVTLAERLHEVLCMLGPQRVDDDLLALVEVGAAGCLLGWGADGCLLGSHFAAGAGCVCAACSRPCGRPVGAGCTACIALASV